MDSLHIVAKDRVEMPVIASSDAISSVQLQDMLTPEQYVVKGDSLRLLYMFNEAASEYQKAISAAADSLDKTIFEDRLILAQNGLSMMSYCNQPTVIAKQKFSIDDFFLYYPLEGNSWRPVPNILDSLDVEDRIAKATYVPNGENTLYYSSADEEYINNIYVTHNLGEEWSAPELVNEHMTSSSDEIFPMVSPDGRSLYFASKGLYGMGGYDLYVSQWNRETKDWDVPVNMGFPYSSPYDDFLFVNSADGKYSLFASNRECSKDSVYVYVLEYDSMPVRKSITDVNDLRSLASLAVGKNKQGSTSNSAEKLPDNADTKLYMSKMTEVRELRESIYQFGKALDEDRLKLSSLEGSSKTDLMNDILEREMSLPAMNDSLSKAVKQLQQIEMDFLVKGFVIDPEKVQADVDQGSSNKRFTFVKKSMGEPLEMVIQTPKSNFDYTFMILPEGRFAEDNTLPDGIVYQIQLFTKSTKATVADINGLSPVFEKLNPSLKYTYSVGLFNSYKDVLANLNRVKRAGFKSAFITAYNNGKSIPVAEARSKEAQILTLYSVKMYPDGQSLPDLAKTAIKQHTAKDIVRMTEDGNVVFVAGPFDEKEKAEALVTALKATGVATVKIETSISE